MKLHCGCCSRLAALAAAPSRSQALWEALSRIHARSRADLPKKSKGPAVRGETF